MYTYVTAGQKKFVFRGADPLFPTDYNAQSVNGKGFIEHVHAVLLMVKDNLLCFC